MSTVLNLIAFAMILSGGVITFIGKMMIDNAPSFEKDDGLFIAGFGTVLALVGLLLAVLT